MRESKTYMDTLWLEWASEKLWRCDFQTVCWANSSKINVRKVLRIFLAAYSQFSIGSSRTPDGHSKSTSQENYDVCETELVQVRQSLKRPFTCDFKWFRNISLDSDCCREAVWEGKGTCVETLDLRSSKQLMVLSLFSVGVNENSFSVLC